MFISTSLTSARRTPGKATWDSSIAADTANPVPTVRQNRSSAGASIGQQEPEGQEHDVAGGAGQGCGIRSPSRRLTTMFQIGTSWGFQLCGSGPGRRASGSAPDTTSTAA